MLEGEEGVPECFLPDLVGGRLGMGREVADGPDRDLLRPFGQATQLSVLDHPLVQWGHGFTSCTYG